MYVKKDDRKFNQKIKPKFTREIWLALEGEKEGGEVPNRVPSTYKVPYKVPYRVPNTCFLDKYTASVREHWSNSPRKGKSPIEFSAFEKRLPSMSTDCVTRVLRVSHGSAPFEASWNPPNEPCPRLAVIKATVNLLQPRADGNGSHARFRENENRSLGSASVAKASRKSSGAARCWYP